jgi:hypothetical protein
MKAANLKEVERVHWRSCTMQNRKLKHWRYVIPLNDLNIYGV